MGLVVLFAGGSPFAQTPSGTEALIEEARKSGSTVIVITPPATAPAPTAAAEPVPAAGFEAALGQASAEIRRIVNGWDALRAEGRAALVSHGTDGTLGWVLPMLLLGLALFGIGALLAWLGLRWTRSYFATVVARPPANRAERLTRLFALALARAAALAALLVIALVLSAFFWPGIRAWRITIASFGIATAMIGGCAIAFGAALSPGEPHLRPVALADGESRRLFAHLMIAAIIAIALLAFARWMLLLGVPRPALKPAVILASLVTSTAFCLVAIVNRAPVGRLIAGLPADRPIPAWRRALARFWPLFAIAYFLLAWMVTTIRILIDRPSAFGLIAMPILAIIAAFALYGLALLIIDLIAARRAAVRATASEESVPVADAGPPSSRDLSLSKKVFEHAAAVIALAIGLYLLARLWGIDELAGENVSAAIVELTMVLLLAYIAYQAARLWIDGKMAAEAHRAATGGVSGAHASSRLATLLPIFRNFLLIAIVVMSALVVLSRMGVDIGPLIAGAGVVGLAIGFGAQTLVKDIISGAFFLADDAFRVGEYIDIGSGKGTVEKISVRSMQLRHQDGPVNTVPFGSIEKVSNFSRDWAIMKIPLRVTYDTDAERVRKLVKKLGEELLRDPELGPDFLEPLKSQGIVAMEDSAMIIRVKFKTRPGNQSEIRKAVYARIRELFQREGIQFAQKEVRVRIADDEAEGDGNAPSPRQRAALNAAAEAVVEEDDAKARAAAQSAA